MEGRKRKAAGGGNEQGSVQRRSRTEGEENISRRTSYRNRLRSNSSWKAFGDDECPRPVVGLQSMTYVVFRDHLIPNLTRHEVVNLWIAAAWTRTWIEGLPVWKDILLERRMGTLTNAELWEARDITSTSYQVVDPEIHKRMREVYSGRDPNQQTGLDDLVIGSRADLDQAMLKEASSILPSRKLVMRLESEMMERDFLLKFLSFKERIMGKVLFIRLELGDTMEEVPVQQIRVLMSFFIVNLRSVVRVQIPAGSRLGPLDKAFYLHFIGGAPVFGCFFKF